METGLSHCKDYILDTLRYNVRDKDNWAEANKTRDYWGTKNYSPDMDFSHCKQSEPTDKHGTVHDIANAMYYYYPKVHDDLDLFTNSELMLRRIQEGMADETIKSLGVKKPKDPTGMIKVGTPTEIANKVHHTLDWLRATRKRKWDDRGMNPKIQIIEYCIKGLYLNSATLLHYDESPER